jgi:hypothetical protein
MRSKIMYARALGDASSRVPLCDLFCSIFEGQSEVDELAKNKRWFLGVLDVHFLRLSRSVGHTNCISASFYGLLVSASSTTWWHCFNSTAVVQDFAHGAAETDSDRAAQL